MTCPDALGWTRKAWIAWGKVRFPVAHRAEEPKVNSETGRGGDPNPASDQRTPSEEVPMAAEPLYRASESAQVLRGAFAL